jgi:hypothetical protein
MKVDSTSGAIEFQIAFGCSFDVRSDRGYAPEIVYNTFNNQIYVGGSHSAQSSVCMGRFPPSGTMSLKAIFAFTSNAPMNYQMVVIPSTGNIIHIAHA